MLVIVTGGIGSGKSTLASQLSKIFPTYSTFSVDTEVGKIYENPAFLKAIKEHFGTSDKKVISDLVFGDLCKKQELEKIASPFLEGRRDYILRQENAIVEFPLYFEYPGVAARDACVVAVSCDYDVRARRVEMRDGTRRVKFMSIADSQISDPVREAMADFHIRTDVGHEQFERDFRVLAQDLRRKALKSRFNQMVGPADWPRLQAHYEQPHRAYHTFEHLSEMFATLDALDDVPHRSAIEMAIWYHDLVYEVPAREHGSNETDSIKSLWTGYSEGGFRFSVNKGDVLLAAELIAATVQHHPHSTYLTSHPDRRRAAEIFLDLDLAILASHPSRFSEYEKQIRKEYGHVPDELYYQGRLQVMQRFNERERLFLSPQMSHLEASARHNLSELIEALKVKVF